MQLVKWKWIYILWIYILFMLIVMGIILGILFLRETPILSENPILVPTPYILKTPTKQEFYSCDGNIEFNSGNYKILNNVWNKRVLKANETYQQCIRVKNTEASLSVSAEWNWSWPKGDGAVKAYPEIIYGWAPWLPTSTDTYLPVQLSKLGGFVASYDVSVITTKETMFNTAFDIWITSAAQPTPANRTTEIMIWVNQQNMPEKFANATIKGRETIDGEEYDYGYWNKQGTHDYIKFLKVVPQKTGSIIVDHFLKFLLEGGYISVNEYLADIEFGNEIVFGTGQTIIRSYSVIPSD